MVSPRDSICLFTTMAQCNPSRINSYACAEVEMGLGGLHWIDPQNLSGEIPTATTCRWCPKGIQTSVACACARDREGPCHWLVDGLNVPGIAIAGVGVIKGSQGTFSNIFRKPTVGTETVSMQ